MISLRLGEFRTIPGRPGVVVGVPHGTFDAATDEIGASVAALTGAGAVIATGFCASRTDGIRLNVNRPTEGASLTPTAEAVTARARAVHAAYVARVRAVASGPLAVYCEIHGNSRPIAAGRIEVATAGVDATLATRLKQAAHEAERRLKAVCGSGLWLCVEPTDRLHFTASSARRWPPFVEASRVLHVELPRVTRANPVAAKAAAALVAVLIAAVEAAR
ncbi:MAG: hypothetical protein ACRELA_21435 [Candidatus Rokuibacteriota bacterium]